MEKEKTGLPRFLLYKGGDAAAARALAAHLSLPFLTEGEEDALYLLQSEKGLSLCRGGLELRGDFSSLLPRLKPANQKSEMLLRAVKGKRETPPFVLDATAGMGEDSFLLAGAGCRVLLYEYDPVIFALLQDAHTRAAGGGLGEIVSRMELFEGDSIAAMASLTCRPDVILLDPMFPQRQKSGLVKKKFQLLHALESPCENEDALLSAAMAAHPEKIVIKRPEKGPYLGGVRPSYSLFGNSVRYDCLVLPK